MSHSDSGTELLKHLKSLETELHHPGAVCSKERIETLLHPEFQEVGKSGQVYDRPTIVDFLSGQTKPHLTKSDAFKVFILANDCALLTYRCIHLGSTELTHNYALRSSVWRQTKSGWQLFYHQGTPCSKDQFEDFPTK